MQVVCFIVGASIGFYQGNVRLLVEDIQALKPTIFAGVPRVHGRLYDKVCMGWVEGRGRERHRERQRAECVCDVCDMCKCNVRESGRSAHTRQHTHSHTHAHTHALTYTYTHTSAHKHT